MNRDRYAAREQDDETRDPAHQLLALGRVRVLEVLEQRPLGTTRDPNNRGQTLAGRVGLQRVARGDDERDGNASHGDHIALWVRDEHVLGHEVAKGVVPCTAQHHVHAERQADRLENDPDDLVGILALRIGHEFAIGGRAVQVIPNLEDVLVARVREDKQREGAEDRDRLRHQLDLAPARAILGQNVIGARVEHLEREERDQEDDAQHAGERDQREGLQGTDVFHTRE